MAEINWIPESTEELLEPSVQEPLAIRSVVVKLRELGAVLSFPHQSSVRGTECIRELRPRSGRSRWRVFYRRTGIDQFVIAAIGPEAFGGQKRFSAKHETS